MAEKERLKLIAKEWKDLQPKDKEVWNVQAKKLKEKYKADMEIYIRSKKSTKGLDNLLDELAEQSDKSEDSIKENADFAKHVKAFKEKKAQRRITKKPPQAKMPAETMHPKPKETQMPPKPKEMPMPSKPQGVAMQMPSKPQGVAMQMPSKPQGVAMQMPPKPQGVAMQMPKQVPMQIPNQKQVPMSMPKIEDPSKKPTKF